MHVRHPSKALLRSQAYKRNVEDTANSGKEWATNDTPIGVLSAYIDSIALETTLTLVPLPDPENFWLPNSYSKAMSRLDIVTNNTSLPFFFNMCLPYALYFYLSKHEFTYRNTRIIKHMLNMCLPHGKHAFYLVFTTCRTCCSHMSTLLLITI
jgi:hypothetical protein